MSFPVLPPQTVVLESVELEDVADHWHILAMTPIGLMYICAVGGELFVAPAGDPNLN